MTCVSLGGVWFPAIASVLPVFTGGILGILSLYFTGNIMSQYVTGNNINKASEIVQPQNKIVTDAEIAREV
jgi:hypothetical protein